MRAAAAGVLLLAVLAAAALAATRQDPAPPAEPALPAPGEPLPRSAAGMAAAFTQTTDRLRAATDAWRRGGDISRGAPPREVVLLALHHQRMLRHMASRPALRRATTRRLPRRVRPQAANILAAMRALRRLAGPPQKRVRLRTGRPLPAGVLLRHYRKAERRFRVSRRVLAAVNLIESAFGKVRNDSVAGARGPMQFIPSTWRAYGLGGNIHDPHDAILGAANYLRASGAPANYRRALFAYNRSTLYVEAVLRYAKVMRDERDLLALYGWQVYVRDARGERRVTGPR